MQAACSPFSLWFRMASRFTGVADAVTCAAEQAGSLDDGYPAVSTGGNSSVHRTALRPSFFSPGSELDLSRRSS
jgi:hypothetical protein